MNISTKRIGPNLLFVYFKVTFIRKLPTPENPGPPKSHKMPQNATKSPKLQRKTLNPCKKYSNCQIPSKFY